MSRAVQTGHFFIIILTSKSIFLTVLHMFRIFLKYYKCQMKKIRKCLIRREKAKKNSAADVGFSAVAAVRPPFFQF